MFEARDDVALAGLVLVSMAYLVVKHAIADFVFQSEIQRIQKAKYGAGGGIIHALIHIVMSAPIFLILPWAGFGRVTLVLAIEFAAHYHIDWFKERIVRSNGWATDSRYFWWAIGIDQMLHGLTYILLIYLIIR